MTANHAKTKERNLWQWLKEARLVHRDRLHMVRVENSAGSGMPDVEGKLKRLPQFWIELKTEALPKRASTKIKPKIRPSQIEWFRKRRKAGERRLWVLLQLGSGRNPLRFLIHGAYINDLKRGMTLEEIKDIAYRVDSVASVIQIATEEAP